MISARDALFNALKMRGFVSKPTRQRVDSRGTTYDYKMVGTIEYRGMTDEVTYWITRDGHIRVGKTIQRCTAVVEDLVVELLVQGGYAAAYDLENIEEDIICMQMEPDADPVSVQHDLAIAEYDKRIARRCLGME